MLVLYRRHLAECSHKAKGRTFKRCHCPIWLQGTIAGQPLRKSLDVTSWPRAEQLKLEIENGNTPKKNVSIKDTLAAWVKDCEDRNLAKNTLRKYRSLQGHLTKWADRQRLSRIGEFQTDMVKAFRGTRNLSPRTSSKENGFLRAFFAYCIEREWITKNPAKKIKVQVKTIPRIPFSEKEIRTILSKAKDDRELAFLLTLRHTGLRIGDASLLRVSQMNENRIHLYTTKAGTPVSILIPEILSSLLKALPPKGGYFFLRGESTHPHTASDLWRKRIKAICKEAKITPDHPHRFRHSLAAELLNKGASVEQVAAILGNSPGVVAKHYSQWIKSRQDNLDAFLEKTWEKPALTLVK